MKYTITEQISVSPLNNNLRECQISEEAKYQMEIYKTRETTNSICMVHPFNGNKFTHPVNSTVQFVPGKIVRNIILPARVDCITKSR